MIAAPLAQDFFTEASPVHRRTYTEFAEQDLILPKGPKAGLPWRCDYFPPSRELLAEFSRGRFNEFYGSGPTQTGKTLLFFILPTMYHAFECEEDVILGAPVVEMAQAAYIERLLPAIEASRYKRLLPRVGGGSRGGRALFIQFGNGASIRFMGAGGGDQQRSSYTARVAVCTELDKMDEAGATSRESDPVSQIKARTSAYGAAARFYGECTMSVKGGRIHREVVERGTDSRVFLPCQACGEWVLPAREGLIGWQGAPNVLAARERARFECPSCRHPWTEQDRQKALRDPRIVAKDQKVGKDGIVQGPLPPTMTFGFRWNGMASPLRTMADIADDEWEAEQSGLDSDQKALVQFTWAEAWEEEVKDLNRPEIKTILQKIVNHPKGTVPPDTFKLTLGIDVGKYYIWWSLWAWKPDGQGHLVGFDGIKVAGAYENPHAVLMTLQAFRDNVIKPGWGGRQPDRILIDSGYETDAVYEFVRESGEPRYLACKGWGTSSRWGAWRDPVVTEPTDTRAVGVEYTVSVPRVGTRLVNVHADYWKARIHDGFAAGTGAPGSLTLYHGEKTDQELRKFARMIVAEQRKYSKPTEGKEARVVWVILDRMNHCLDTSAYAACAAGMLGVKVVKLSAPPPPPRHRPPSGERLKWSRDRY